MSNYKINSDASPVDLAFKVNAEITGGASVLGSPLLDPRGYWHQATGPAPAGGGGLPEGSVAVANGDTITIVSSTVTITTGTAIVAEGQVGVDIGANRSLVSNEDLVTLSNDSGAHTANASIIVSGPNNTVSVKLANDHDIVANNGTVAVLNSTHANSHNATADVSVTGVLTGVVLPDTQCIMSHGDSVPVFDSAGDAVTGTHTVEVINGVFNAVDLAATVAAVPNAFELDGVAPTGAYTSKITFTVTDGKITAVALS